MSGSQHLSGREGPWLEIGPWRRWLEGKLDRGSKAELARRLGITNRRLYAWLRSKQQYVKMNMVEDALWEYDCLDLHEQLGYDITIYEFQPEKRKAVEKALRQYLTNVEERRRGLA